MKRWYQYICIIGMALCMTGCSLFSGTNENLLTSQQVSTTERKEQQAVAKAYMDAMQAGNLSGALSYCTDDFEDGTKVKTLKEKLTEIIQKYHLSNYSSQADKLIQEATQKVFQSYTFHSSDNEVSAKVSAIRVDTVERKIRSLIKDFMASHAGDVFGILASGGNEEAIQKLAPDAIQYITSHTEEELNSLKYEDMTIQFSFKKVDGSWKIAKTQLINS